MKGIKKNTIKGGLDSKKSVLNKMAKNLINYGKISTTVKRAKILRGYIDRLINKLKKNDDSDMFMPSFIRGQKKLIKIMKIILPLTKNRISGFTTIRRVPHKKGDGSDIAQVEWVEEIKKIYSDTNFFSKKSKNKEEKKTKADKESKKKREKEVKKEDKK